MATRARFVVSGNEVTLTALNPYSGEIETTTYFVPYGDRPKYVRIRDKEGRNPQVCEMLALRGSTLMATAATLADVIRKEYRAARAYHRRQEERWR
jgi:hypothetical protein